MKFHEFVRVPMVSDRAKCAIQISKDKALMPLLTANSNAFVYFCASIVCPSHNFENSQHLSNSTELQTKDIARSSYSKQWRKWHYKSRENPVPSCINQDASMDHLLAGRYQAAWGQVG